MNKKIEKKLACYICRTIDYNEYEKIRQYMGKDKYLFDDWITKIGRSNIEK